MTNPRMTGIQFDSRDSGVRGGGAVKITCHSRFRLERQTILSYSLAHLSQRVSPVTLISHYFYTVIHC